MIFETTQIYLASRFQAPSGHQRFRSKFWHDMARALEYFSINYLNIFTTDMNIFYLENEHGRIEILKDLTPYKLIQTTFHVGSRLIAPQIPSHLPPKTELSK